MPEVTPPRPSLPPNMIRLRGKLVERKTSDTDVISSLRVEVQEIVAKGSATPPVAATDTLLVKATAFPDTLKPGMEFTGTFSHHQVFGQPDNKTGSWQLEQIDGE